ncbi:uncharacterized protein PHACADRAFT_251531 [Phanerochaete carnosa HHB-10118-sp]|uniref:Uncharacterized protein n=1 Tax=Phanerochaete carnosa (strain HHB-10118-sp) TaxID=650164 RepID=K5X4G2_PHACS|nr:uncharacterized protein PHACADRAFT_251531 [Phanerochaete carnosa HHB-10118-sp]EKM57722.1 hypothetical protein PHACADRAFT_251531 [Phanerochaete carnosa HHB-10118-sp]
MSTEDIEKEILAVYAEDRSLRSLVQELVCLRSTHRCQHEGELEALRQKIRSLKEKNEVLQVVVGGR